MSIRHYDEHGEAFFRETVDAEMAGLRERFLAHPPPGGRILDAGCGSGRDALAFHRAGYDVIAFDGSAKMAELAAAHTGLDVACMTFDEADWDGEFDGVWASASLLHVPRAALTATCGRLIRALKPGGVMFASFKRGDQEREVGARRFTDMTEAALRSLVKDLGLAELDVWESQDSRPERRHEWWVSAIGRKPG